MPLSVLNLDIIGNDIANDQSDSNNNNNSNVTTAEASGIKIEIIPSDASSDSRCYYGKK